MAFPRSLARSALLVLVVLLLAACSDSSDEAANTTVAPSTTIAATTTTVAPTTSITTTSTVATTTTTTAATTTTRGPSVSLSNGGFESGDFTGWSTDSWGGHGDWFVYEDGTMSPDPSMTDPDVPFNVPEPPEGQYAAVTDMDYSGAHFLYRDIEVAGSWMLHAVVFYENGIDQFYVQPDFGSFDGEAWFAGSGVTNQQFRIDVIDPDAPIHSTEADDVLAVVFQTQSGDPPSMGPTPVSIDLSPWEGTTIRLRAVQIDNKSALRAGIDDVRLELNG